MADDGQKPEGTLPAASTDEGRKVAEENAALKAEIEAIKRAQAGSDAKVAKLLSELEQTGKGKQTAEERIAALETENTEAKRQAERERFLNAGYKLATERNLPAWLVDDYGGPPEKLAEFLDRHRKHQDEIATAKAREILSSGAKPGSGTPGTVDVSRMTPKERLAHFQAETEKRMGG